MNILSYNPGHDGAIAYLKGAHLFFSIEAEKNSNWRHSPISSRDVFDALGEIDDIPDVICTSAGGHETTTSTCTGRMFSIGAFRRATSSLTNGAYWEGQSTISRLLTSDRTYFALSACRACRKVPHAMRWYGKGR